MGQAAIDLPDPTQAPPAAASSADDLLSQLAGDEIDRLLAEAEVEKGSPPEAAADAPAAEAPVAEAPVAKAAPAPEAPAPSVQARKAEAPKVEPPAAASAAKDPAPAGPTDAEQAATNAAFEDAAAAAINELLNAATGEPPPAAAPAAPEPTTVTSVVIELPPSVALTDPTAAAKELDEALAKGSAAALPEVKLETETSNQEKSALAEVVQAMDEIGADPEISFDGAPWYLKPLVWLNAPFAMLPEPVRDALGKIGILTFVNAIAVFAYLLLFRRHHH